MLERIAIWLFFVFFLAVIGSGCTPIPRSEASSPAWVAPLFNPNKHVKLALIVEVDKFGKHANSTAVARQVEGAVTEVLLSKGYRISARSDIEKMQKEIRYQQSSGWTEGNAARLGKMLNVSCVVIITIVDYKVQLDARNYAYIAGAGYLDGLSAKVSMSGRIVSVEEAEIVGQANYIREVNVRRKDDFPTALGVAAREFVNGFPSRI
ncbi:MAG: CsgG/HfaB family protein [Candidatus Accumulibacter necessarius]|jgi:hypothetical protein|uniref:CsgG/HfaB family protein n=1 Tax=Candidatus Accumulibacter necessarius TaxID=2954386 RepID=UPI002FC2ACD1